MPTIRRRRDFLAASRGNGKKVVTGGFIVQAHRRAADHPAGNAARVGFTVTKKMGNAVVRNRIKRRLREAVRKTQTPGLDGHDYIVISRPKALDCPFEALLRDMEFAFLQIAAKKNAS